mgnify:CR=1 FL=1
MINIDYGSMWQLTGASKDTKLLWRLGHFIYINGCRRDFELAITDMYLRGKMSDSDCEKLRGLVSDEGIEPGLISPRLNSLTILINKINGIIN